MSVACAFNAAGLVPAFEQAVVLMVVVDNSVYAALPAGAHRSLAQAGDASPLDRSFAAPNTGCEDRSHYLLRAARWMAATVELMAARVESRVAKVESWVARVGLLALSTACDPGSAD